MPIDSSYCDQYDGPKPSTVQSCNVGLECPLWHSDPWKPVSNSFNINQYTSVYVIITRLIINALSVKYF